MKCHRLAGRNLFVLVPQRLRPSREFDVFSRTSANRSVRTKKKKIPDFKRFCFPGTVRGRQLRAGDHAAPVQAHIAGRLDRARLETADRGELGRPAARQQQDARAT